MNFGYIPACSLVAPPAVALVWGILLAICFCGCCTSPKGRAHSPTHPKLREELLAMERADQAARQAWLASATPARMANIMELDRKHTLRMKQIFVAAGWPTVSMVGKEGAHAAWLVVQHAAQDPNFMKRCLKEMGRAVQRGEASATDAAFLVDRVRTNEGKPQVYGTQFRDTPDGKMEPYPIENPSGLDRRRRQVGLPPMRAYQDDLRRMHKDFRSADSFMPAGAESQLPTGCSRSGKPHCEISLACWHGSEDSLGSPVTFSV